MAKARPAACSRGFVNQPINDKIAVRAVGYIQHDGGYIDNTPASLTFHFANQYPGQSVTENNANMVKKDFNPIDVYGGRIALRYEVTPDLIFTPMIMGQSEKTQGSFLYDPRLPDLTVHDFSPTSNDDQWYLASATLEGHTGLMDFIYSGSYLHRNIVTRNDYTYYAVRLRQNPWLQLLSSARRWFPQSYSVLQGVHDAAEVLPRDPL